MANPLELVYKTVDDLEISLDIYLPGGASKTKPSPVLLWWHGGGLLQGTRKAISPHMLAAPAKHGICVVSADYRLAPQVRFPDILSDCKAAIEFVRSPEFAFATGNTVDSSQLIMSGSSAGGWLALLSGTGIGFRASGLEPPAPPIGIVSLYPITDLLYPFWTTKQHPVSYLDRVLERSEVEPYINPDSETLSFSSLDSKRNMFYHYMVQEGLLSSLLLDGTNISPSAFSVAPSLASGKFPSPPLYIVHGSGDDKVPHQQSLDVVAALKGRNAFVEYHELDGLDHLFDNDPAYDMKSLYDFIASLTK